jgi:Ser/Thr protein kinase RdoA (MazF antagonist)
LFEVHVEQLEPVVGAPLGLELLNQRAAGGRTTYRVRGTRRTAIVKVYDVDLARTVARRLSSLVEGPFEPLIPKVLSVSDDTIVFSEIEGRPLRAAVLANDEYACRRAGTVLGFWHFFWRGRSPDTLASYTLKRELESLRLLGEQAPEPIAEAVAFGVKEVENDQEWPAATVVHGNLDEEQVVFCEEVGLIELDDVGTGPPEFDVGNLCAHLELVARRYDRDLDAMQHAFLDGYLSSGAPLDLPLLLTCRSLSLLRLACIHRNVHLATAHAGSAWPSPPDVASAG